MHGRGRGVVLAFLGCGPEDRPVTVTEGLFRRVLDRSDQAIFVSLADTGEAVDVNQTALDWLGYTRDEFLDVGVMGVEVRYPIQNRAQWAAHIREMRDAGHPKRFRDGELRRKDGSTILVDIGVTLETHDGVEYAVGVARDVGAERKAEEELRLTQLAVDEAAEAMFRVGPDARILACNQTACDRLGYTAEEVLEMRIFDFDPDNGPDVWPQHWEGIRAEKQLTIETNHRKKDGTVFPVEVSITYIPAGRFHGEHCSSFIRDISDRRELEKRLRLADRMTTIGTLAAGVAHEINNPLQYVMLSFDFLQRSMKADASAREVLADAQEGCQRIRDIVAGLQVLSRTDESAAVPVSVHAALDFALKISHTHYRHRAKVRQERSLDDPFVIAPRGHLGQVLLNIILNAAQAFDSAEPDNVISVRTHIDQVADRVIIDINDNGCGIPEDKVDRIYDAFFTTKAPGVGTGLGLPISQSILTRIGGELVICSDVGEGTAVRISIPAAENPAHAAVEGGKASTGKVLIVDDNPMVARAFSRALDGFFVASALDGHAALRLLKETQFDVVLCDVMMPGLSGPALFEKAVELDPAWKSRFVFVTGGACTEETRRFLDQTECECLDKPLRSEDLRRVAERFSSRRE